MRRYEFMSPEWISMARSRITDALAATDVTGETFTISEEFENAPRHLRRDGADTIGFSVRVGDGSVEVGDVPEPDADCRIISDYADGLAVARDPDAAATDPAEAQRRIAEGRLRIEGDPSRMPAVLQQLDIHRLLADATL
jgi:hypothetical protein